MPFKSEKQRKWMHANEPEMAKKWEKEEESVDEEKKRDYKAEYKKYGSSTKAKKYRAELNQYNRKKGTYGNGDGKDASHKGGKIVGFENQSVNRGRAEKSRLRKEAIFEDMNDAQLAKGIKHWASKHKGTGIGYGHVLGQLAVHMKEMGWNKSYKEVARIAVELGKKKTVESIKEALLNENPAAAAGAAMAAIQIQNAQGKKIKGTSALQSSDPSVQKKAKGIFNRLKDKFAKKKDKPVDKAAQYRALMQKQRESVNEISFSHVSTQKLVKSYKQMADERLSGAAALTFRLIAKELKKRKVKLPESVNEAKSFKPEKRRKLKSGEIEVMKGRGSKQKWFYVKNGDDVKTLVRLGRNYGFPTGIAKNNSKLKFNKSLHLKVKESVNEDWWSEMSSYDQAQYIKDHPNSAKAKSSKKARKEKEADRKKLAKKGYDIDATTGKAVKKSKKEDPKKKEKHKKAISKGIFPGSPEYSKFMKEAVDKIDTIQKNFKWAKGKQITALKMMIDMDADGLAGIIKNMKKNPKAFKQFVTDLSKMTGMRGVGESVKESTKSWNKSLEKIARDRQLKSISKKDRETLMRIAQMMKKANESVNEAGLEMNKLKDAIKMFQKKIKKQGRVTNARDEEHLKNLIKVYKQMGGKGVKEAVVKVSKDISGNPAKMKGEEKIKKLTYSGSNGKGSYEIKGKKLNVNGIRPRDKGFFVNHFTKNTGFRKTNLYYDGVHWQGKNKF
jgi:hypothetical protein